EVVALCDIDEAVLAQHASSYGVSRTYTDYRDLCADDEVDAVCVCTPNALHADVAICALEHGKHIIVEKPLALSLEDMRAIEHAVRAARVGFCICFECRFSSQFRTIKAVIDRGLLGDLHYGEVDYYHGIGPWYGEWRWAQKKEGGGSSLLEAGCHAMDALLLCLGEDVDEVMSYAAGSSSAIFEPYEYPSTSVTILRWRDGTVGKCASVIDCLQPYYFHTHLVGSEGSLLDDKFHSNLLSGMDRSRWGRLPLRLLDSGDVADHPYRTQFDAFFEALDRGEEMPLTGLREAVATHEVIFAADRSAAEGRPVRLTEIRGG
ncbi:MAG: Gfo/Idh/MocA family oxidoreductase, partial [Planctomycetes bacterium]|nr:Gfo/Idh/MocA family oxidoreductase [Planctomycetota bacterium]